MSSVRLRPDQIARLKRDGYGPATVRHAIKRWKRGDFSLDNAPAHETNSPLQVYPIWRKPKDVTDAQLRAILDCHWATPDKQLHKQLDAELAYWDRKVAEGLALVPQVPYILLDNEEFDQECKQKGR